MAQQDVDFSWIPFFEHMAEALLAWRDRQPELLAFLEELRTRKLPVTPLGDRDETGRQFPLAEIDPFTFLGAFNRGIQDDARRQMLAAARNLFGLTTAAPTGFSGVPLLNNQRSWFIGYQARRGPEDVRRLWDVYERALGEDPLRDPAFLAAFDRALQVWGTNVNLTIGLFWIRPRRFLSLDSTMRAHTGVVLPPRGLDAEWYTRMLEQVESKYGDDLPGLSAAAWLARSSDVSPSALPPTREDVDYWFVGSYWDDAPEADQTRRFLSEGIWENGYRDRYLDEVRAMRPGDRIVIKASTVQNRDLPFDARGHSVSKMILKAVGTVVANRGDGRIVEVEWTPLDPPRAWYFYTSLRTLWRLRKKSTLAQRLIRFVSHGEAQDFDYFTNRWWGPGVAAVAPATGAADVEPTPAIPPYGAADLKREGVFLTEEEVHVALRRLRAKKNLVLQGAPGTGKTFVARKLAYMLMAERDPSRVTTVQFHPSTSYEDFVRGYRPTDQAGQFLLRDGPFLELCARARTDERPHVLILDEINRGNLAQIFGELLMLLEHDKRGKEQAVTPLYRRSPDERLEVPENVYVIGTMNLADRSLALVDFALRRRFAFVMLEPRFAAPEYAAWLRERGMNPRLIQRIVARMGALNRTIAEDARLGPSLCIGHSFFCPTGQDFSELDEAWYREIVETEVAPMLEEYWHDDRGKAHHAREALLA
ncbi:AAA family ATPase [Nannocystis punicea]|uniref:AAA family ATPase n=1 Tax=Nannocystis punicea TaxID=2995304 RepID=A0ABY7HBJ9_9BACT|nr:AAA family ATPase [Nannocystis poenicansa]WAS96409.1 AAA family ATPase [Nannocystis poenicansa]